LAQLESEERKEFLREEGLEESGLDQFIKASYKLLDLVTFFTTVGPEVRAWTINKGTRAPQAAGKVHSDMERGFIRAEVVSYGDLLAAGSVPRARELGIYRLEGKDYVVQDGDVTYFRFAV
ncbi:ribosome-binding ATPase, partial [Candidatus Hakubella thermalkaliphila]